MNNPAPANYSTVCPYIMVNNVEKQIDFMLTVFDCECKERMKNGDGIIMHGEIKMGDSVIMFGRIHDGSGSGAGMNYVYVHDADTVYNKAMAAGSTSIYAPDDKFYGVREGGFKDPEGNTWYVANVTKQVSPEEAEAGFADKKVS